MVDKNQTSDTATAATVEIKESELKLLIELAYNARSLAWSVRNYRGELKDGIEVGMGMSNILRRDDGLNKIIDNYPTMHPYD